MTNQPRPDAPEPAFDLKERVHRACAALALAGRSVTNEAVREAIGGSYRDIAPLVKAYKAMQRTAPVAPEQAGLPGNVVEAVQLLQTHLQAGADQKVATAHQQLTEVQARAHADLQAAATREAALASENAQLRLDLVNARAQVATLEAYRADQAATIARLEADNAGQVQRLADRAAELHEAREQLKQGKLQYAHLEEKSAFNLTEERRLAAQRYNLLQHDHQQLQHANGGLETALRAADGQVAQLRTEVERGTAAFAAISTEAATARAQRDHASAAQIRAENAQREAAQVAESVARQLGEVKQELAERQGELKRVERDLHKAQNLVDQLNREVVIAKQERHRLEDMLRDARGGE
ncbi:DNA-binding protein [Duganella sp. LjRoot269]|uniref:DNA-binding protein n=1 Tax=Duganella sp. LjRoot269 TaxID=3342305 RepID=UPI003ECE220A